MASAINGTFLGAYRFSKHPITIYHIPPKLPSTPIAPSLTKEQPPLVVFVPGNPGIVDFYIPFLNRLYSRYNNYEILCISHSAHDAASLALNKLGVSVWNKAYWDLFQKEKVYNLEEQVAAKVEVIENFVNYENGDLNKPKTGCSISDVSKGYEPQERDIIIMGHSVGAYIVQRVVSQIMAKQKSSTEGKSSIKINFKLVGLVFPTIIDIGKADSGVLLTRLNSWFSNLGNIVAYLVILLHLIVPKFLLNAIISHFVKVNHIDTRIAGSSTEDILCASDTAKALDDGANLSVENSKNKKEAVLKCVHKLIDHPLVVRQVLGLAKDEMETIKNDTTFNDAFFFQNSLSTKSSQKYKIWAFFAQKDHWVNDNTRKYIKERYFSNANKYQECNAVDELLKLKHSFVINHSDQFADITTKAIDELLENN